MNLNLMTFGVLLSGLLIGATLSRIVYAASIDRLSTRRARKVYARELRATRLDWFAAGRPIVWSELLEEAAARYRALPGTPNHLAGI